MKQLDKLLWKIIHPDDERWKNYKPTSVSEMLSIGRRVTPCELLRQIYQMTDDPYIKLRCCVATTVAKSMAIELTKYLGWGWSKKVYPKNPNRDGTNEDSKTYL